MLLTGAEMPTAGAHAAYGRGDAAAGAHAA